MKLFPALTKTTRPAVATKNVKDSRKKYVKNKLIIPVMPVHQAQLTKVCRIDSFLSPSDIAEVLAFAEGSNLPEYTTNQYDDVSASGEPLHTTMYLQTNNLFETEMKWLHKKIVKLVKKVNRENNWGFNIENEQTHQFNIRVAEYHEMHPGGTLRDVKHYDIGSLITVDIMLQEATEGANFMTLEHDPTNTDHNYYASSTLNTANSSYLQEYKFTPGDALLFVAHKYHCVRPLVAGCRKVLVWNFGVELNRHVVIDVIKLWGNALLLMNEY